MAIFRKKFFLTLLLVTFCVFSAGNAQESSDEVDKIGSSSQDSSPQPLDDTEPVNEFNSLQQAVRNYDFESAWEMLSQNLRQVKFAGDVEIFKTHFSNFEHYNALVNFGIEKTKFLNKGKIELLAADGSGYLMSKEDYAWKFDGKNRDKDPNVKDGKSKGGKKGQGKEGGKGDKHKGGGKKEGGKGGKHKGGGDKKEGKKKIKL